MATPSLSATFNFVKKYPITLCGFSLLFMPSVHRLLLYFTPLLLSTAIFIVAMMSWGPKAASEKRTIRLGKPRLVGERPEWAFHETMGMEEEEEEEEEEKEKEEEVEEEITQIEPHLGSKLKGKLEPDPNLGEEDGPLARITACEGEPNRDFTKVVEPEPTSLYGKESIDTGTNASDADRQAESNLGRVESSGAGADASGADRQAEPDPDLQGECVRTTAKDGADSQYDMGPTYDISHDAHGHSGHVMGHTHDHKHEQGGAPVVERLPVLQACA